MKIPVIEAPETDPGARRRPGYSDCCTLPASYMSEFSVIGLIVDGMERAVAVMAENGFRVDFEPFGAGVEVAGTAPLPEILEMLSGAGVPCSIGDVIDSIYQG